MSSAVSRSSTVTVSSPAFTSRSRVTGLRTPWSTAPPQGPHDEVLLAADPAEVGRAVAPPATVLVDLEVAGPHVGERLLAVEGDAARLLDVEERARVAGRVGEVHLHPVDHVDELLEAGEVDLDVVVDRDAQVALDRVDELAGSAALDGAVEALGAPARQRHPQVAWQREQRCPLGAGVEPQDHHRVRAQPADVPPPGAGGVVRRQVGGAVDADEQEVAGLVAAASGPRAPTRAAPEAGGCTSSTRS